MDSERSFNRYMVECELYLFASSTFIDKSFNRYMVECESVWLGFCDIIRRVLIDTWWNVNCNNVRAVEMAKAVLIDTWWNVNSAHSFTFARHKCVLIDTWWNVNTNSGQVWKR